MAQGGSSNRSLTTCFALLFFVCVHVVALVSVMGPLGAGGIGGHADTLRAADAAGGTLRFLVPSEHAGRLIGRHGTRIRDIQQRSGTRVQLSEKGDERLVEVTGLVEGIDEAVTMMLDDLARAQRPLAPPLGSDIVAAHVSIAALVPVDLVGWFLGDGNRSPVLKSGGVVVILGSLEAETEKRVTLQGDPGPISVALRLLSLRLRRRARWASAGAAEPPWYLCDTRAAGDPDDSFISTVNFRLALPRGGVAVLGGSGVHNALLSQIREDTGAAIRVHSAAESFRSQWLEIAGNYGAKLHALLEMSCLLMLLPRGAEVSDPGEGGSLCVLEVLLPEAGASALPRSEAKKIAERAIAATTADITSASVDLVSRASETRAEARGINVPCGEGDAFVRLRGRRAVCCAAALALGRATEARAAAHEREHGPPPLLIDYLARWFGDRRTPPQEGAAATGPRRRSELPIAQIASCGPARIAAAAAVAIGADSANAREHPQTITSSDDAIASGDSTGHLPLLGPEGPPASFTQSSSGRASAGPRTPIPVCGSVAPKAQGGSGKRTTKRRRRARLDNPFWEPCAMTGAPLADEAPPQASHLCSAGGLVSGYDDEDEANDCASGVDSPSAVPSGANASASDAEEAIPSASMPLVVPSVDQVQEDPLQARREELLRRLAQLG